jgi:hypothetical protein
VKIGSRMFIKRGDASPSLVELIVVIPKQLPKTLNI